MRIAVTLTTIHKPTVLAKLVEVQQHTKHHVDYIVVGDFKTPEGVREYVESFSTENTTAIYVGLDDTYNLLSLQQKIITALQQHIPQNSFARRNYADLYAYGKGYDIIIRIDDDNFPVSNDFFDRHAVVGTSPFVLNIHSHSGWFNICDMLRETRKLRFYPRGHPFDQRWGGGATPSKSLALKIAVNCGLWIGDPDVDAITRLGRPIEATGLRREWPEQITLANGYGQTTWAPINTQNTAFSRDTIPAAFISPYAGRYDDIISGYFLRRIVDHMGEAVSYGRPLTRQNRNPHNLFDDLEKELHGMRIVSPLCEALRGTELKGKTYVGCYQELITAARNWNLLDPRILDGMQIWADLF
jgi:hypothetical protein